MQAEAGECGFNRAIAVISGKWKPTIIWELHERPLRFGELRRRLNGISEKVLAEQLRQLEDNGIVRRDAHDTVPPAVEYSLTADGLALNTAAHALAEWADRRAVGTVGSPAAVRPGG